MKMKQYLVYGAGPCPLVKDVELCFPSKNFTGVYNDQINELWELAQEYDQPSYERPFWEIGPWVIALDSLQGLPCDLEHEAIGGWSRPRHNLEDKKERF